MQAIVSAQRHRPAGAALDDPELAKEPAG
jgi:hypothetical protein